MHFRSSVTTDSIIFLNSAQPPQFPLIGLYRDTVRVIYFTPVYDGRAICSPQGHGSPDCGSRVAVILAHLSSPCLMHGHEWFSIAEACCRPTDGFNLIVFIGAWFKAKRGNLKVTSNGLPNAVKRWRFFSKGAIEGGSVMTTFHIVTSWIVRKRLANKNVPRLQTRYWLKLNGWLWKLKIAAVLWLFLNIFI